MALYGRQIPHASWREWRQFNPSKFKRYFKFAVLRDPISRFASAFYYLRSGGMNSSDKEFGERVLKPFADPNELAKALIDLELQRVILHWWHFRPQADFVADERGRPQIDLMLRFENLNEAFEAITRKLNVQGCKLPRLNATRERGEPVFDNEALEVLKCLYRTDFLLWQNHTA
jgi:hypothetical protein